MSDKIKLSPAQLRALRLAAEPAGSYLDGAQAPALKKLTGAGLVDQKYKIVSNYRYYATGVGLAYLAQLDRPEAAPRRIKLTPAQNEAVRYIFRNQNDRNGVYLHHLYRATFLTLRNNNLIEVSEVIGNDKRWRLSAGGLAYLQKIDGGNHEG